MGCGSVRDRGVLLLQFKEFKVHFYKPSRMLRETSSEYGSHWMGVCADTWNKIKWLRVSFLVLLACMPVSFIEPRHYANSWVSCSEVSANRYISCVIIDLYTARWVMYPMRTHGDDRSECIIARAHNLCWCASEDNFAWYIFVIKTCRRAKAWSPGVNRPTSILSLRVCVFRLFFILQFYWCNYWVKNVLT